MTWLVVLDAAFERDFDRLSQQVQDELLAQAKVIEQLGPVARRPRVDTLNGSKHANMKELIRTADYRFDAHLRRLRTESGA